MKIIKESDFPMAVDALRKHVKTMALQDAEKQAEGKRSTPYKHTVLSLKTRCSIFFCPLDSLPLFDGRFNFLQNPSLTSLVLAYSQPCQSSGLSAVLASRARRQSVQQTPSGRPQDSTRRLCKV